MLFQSHQHEGLRSGAITRSFRLWKRPQARVGGRYLFTRDEEVEVTGLREISPRSIRSADARAAGFADRAALLGFLEQIAGGPLPTPDRSLYRVDLRYAGRRAAQPPPDAALSQEAFSDLERRLARMDAGKSGPWTRATLALIAARPGLRSADMAKQLDRVQAELKADVRKLKRLGLTRSREVGYELSPRGAAVLARIGPGGRKNRAGRKKS